MTIRKLADRPERKIEIDLTGPQGNVFALMGMAQNLANQIGKDGKQICERMMASDYENAVAVFDKEFGKLVTLYR